MEFGASGRASRMSVVAERPEADTCELKLRQVGAGRVGRESRCEGKVDSWRGRVRAGIDDECDR